MKIKLSCPQCKKDFDFEYETFVDTSTNSAFKGKLMVGGAFAPICDCGAQQVVQYTLLYKDTEHKFAILLQPDEKANLALKDEYPDKQVNEVVEDGSYSMRMVDHSNELAEKIVIFDNGFDDRIIEMVKVYYYDAIREQLHKENTELADMLFGAENGKGSFWIRLEDGRTMTLDLDMDMYNDIAKDTKEKVKKLTPRKFVKINAEWAFKLLSGEEPENYIY